MQYTLNNIKNILGWQIVSSSFVQFYILRTMNLGVTPETTRRRTFTMNLSGYEDLGVDKLGKDEIVKRRRYLNPDNSIWPMGFGLVTSLYKYRNKKPKILDNYFDWLPEEMILNIFKILDRRTLIKCTYVCKKWRRIAYDESLWQCLNIPRRRMTVMALDKLLRRNIKFISLSHGTIIGSQFYTFEIPLSKLQYLDMSAVIISVKLLSSLLLQCHNLVKLSLENCFVDHVCCENIARNKKLKVLNMASSMGLDYIGLMHILSLNNLEELNVSWSHIKNDDLRYLMYNMVQNIKRLNISGFKKLIRDCDLMLLLYRCPQLIELDISDNLSITSCSLYYILKNQPNLKVLSINRCLNAGNRLIESNSLGIKMDNNNCQLQELNLFGIINLTSFHYVCAHVLNFNINKSIYSCIARPKPADNEYTIWEIPIFIDC